MKEYIIRFNPSQTVELATGDGERSIYLHVDSVDAFINDLIQEWSRYKKQRYYDIEVQIKQLQAEIDKLEGKKREEIS